MDLPKTYTFEGQELDLNEGLKHFNTDGLIILHDDKVLLNNIGMEITSKVSIFHGL